MMTLDHQFGFCHAGHGEGNDESILKVIFSVKEAKTFLGLEPDIGYRSPWPKRP